MFTKADAERYFAAEKQESLLFLFIGITAMVTGAIFFFGMKTSFHKGAALSLVLIAIIQIVVGYTVYNRSDDQRKDIVYKMDMDPASIRDKEIPRMVTVMRNFVIYRWTEVALIIIAVLLVYLNRHVGLEVELHDAGAFEWRSFWCGIGVALSIQSGIMLLADGVAENRGRKYLRGLQEWVATASNK